MTRINRRASVVWCSGQSWKLWLMVIGAFAAVVIFMVAESFEHSMSGELNVFLLLLGTASAAGAIAYPLIFIRCPMCKARWFWLAITRERAENWFDWLQGLRDCPKCHVTCETMRINSR